MPLYSWYLFCFTLISDPLDLYFLLLLFLWYNTPNPLSCKSRPPHVCRISQNRTFTPVSWTHIIGKRLNILESFTFCNLLFRILCIYCWFSSKNWWPWFFILGFLDDQHTLCYESEQQEQIPGTWFVLRSGSDRGWRRRERIAGWLCQTSWFSRTRVEVHTVT